MSARLSTLKNKFSVLKSETCFSRASRAETTALRAMFPSFGAFRDLVKPTLCWVMVFVRSAFPFCKEVSGDSWSESA